MEEKRATPERAYVAADAPIHMDSQPSSRRRGGGQKRKSMNSGGGSSNAKRPSREKPPVVPFPMHMNGPLTRARLQPTSSSSIPQEEVVQSVVKSEVEAQEAAARAEEIIRVSENWEALEAEIEADYQGIKARDSKVHVVPVHAGWFSWNEVHPLEKRMLPSFFSGKSDKRNPEMYLEIRDWIMKKFHLDPNVNFEQKDLSELTVGELDARQEVMEFLDYWGLINYHPFPQDESGATNVESDADETHKRESLIEKLYKFETVQSWSPVVPRMDAARPATSSGLFSESVIADELVKSEGPSVEYHCNSCSADCSRKRYHCQKQADFDLCAECFNDGKFGSNMSPSDFIVMEPAESGGASGGNWTDQETLLLLEAIELFRDNWSEIAEHVATKTKAQCILHFVEMPIEDAFFNHDNENDIAPNENGLPVSPSIEDSSAKVDQSGNTASKDVPEKTESVSDNQASSCLVEISKTDEVSESGRSNEVTDSFALKALKEAFEAVGSLPSPGELSFAEASNPVMTLAAYLVRLVEPSIVTASSRSLLKSLSSYHSSELLAARNCFRLEDPPNDEKKIADTEGTPCEKNDPEAKKHKDENTQKENGDTCETVIDTISPQDDKNEESAHEDKKDSVCEDDKPKVSTNDCGDILDGVKEPDEMAIDDPQPTSASEPNTSDTPKELTSNAVEEPVASPSHSQLQTSILKEPENGASAGDTSQLNEPLKDEQMVSNTGEKKIEPLTVSNSVAEKENDTGAVNHKECDTEKKETPRTKNDLQADKLKRVAVSALSAAAVKAKLLADHEEDQIRQLASFLIDKQLQKLESKLAFFTDIENVAIRVKEQLDRSKQKLFHERAQIIATRFGMSASARPNSQSGPPNSAAATAAALANQGAKPIMCMNSVRPPIARPGMAAPNPNPSNFVPANASGNSVHPSYSVGTK